MIMFKELSKKHIIKMLVQLVAGKILLVSLLTGVYFLYKKHQYLLSKLELSKQNLMSLNQDLSYQDKKFHYLVSLKEIYNDLMINKADSNGISIEKMLLFLSKLKTLYQVSNLNVKVLKSVSKTNIVINENSLETAQILIDFDSMDDEISYKFLDSFSNNFPGFIKITNFYIGRNASTNESINNKNRDEIKQLVNAQIIFNWYEFNHDNPKAP